MQNPVGDGSSSGFLHLHHNRIKAPISNKARAAKKHISEVVAVSDSLSLVTVVVVVVVVVVVAVVDLIFEVPGHNE